MDITQRIDQLECVLDLNRRIVGVKFLYHEKAFEQNVMEPVKNMFSFCMMVKVASAGAAIKAKEENFKCPGAKRAFGMMKVDDHFSSGARYLELGLYENLYVAKKVTDNMAFLPRPLFGVAVQPLKAFVEAPDVAIIITDAYNAMRILQGYIYHWGQAKGIRSCGNQGVCCELTAQPYRSNDINVSLLCSGTRFSCRWKDGEVGVGMPFSMLTKVIDGVVKTANAAEPPRRKERIIARAEDCGEDLGITWGENYYRSEPGTGKLKQGISGSGKQQHAPS